MASKQPQKVPDKVRVGGRYLHRATAVGFFCIIGLETSNRPSHCRHWHWRRYLLPVARCPLLAPHADLNHDS